MIELLVVIAIISVLAAILFPVLASVKKKARQAQCASNLKQLASAWLMYAENNNDTACMAAILPCATFEIDWDFTLDRSVTPTRIGPGLLTPYTKSGAVNSCPSFVSMLNYDRPYMGYGYNATYIGGTAIQYKVSSSNRPATRLSMILRSSGTAVFADTAFMSSGVLASTSYLGAPSEDAARLNRRLVHFRHNGKANVAYADGHIQAAGQICRPSVINSGNLTNSFLGTLSPDDSAYDLK